MIRAFVALPLPDPLRQPLNLVQFLLPLPRRVPVENLHLTLLFLAERPGPEIEDLHHELEALRVPGFDLTLRGVGSFGDPPRSVHAGVPPNPPLDHLRKKVETAARRCGLDLPRRRFQPHVTLGRCDPARMTPADRARLQAAMADQATFTAGPAPVEAFALYRSWLGREGAHHEELARYPLIAP